MNNSRINIFVLAAGRGERLQPITDRVPKPLVPLLGRPAIEYVLDVLTGLPYNKIGINLHHRKEDMEEWAASHPLRESMLLFYEKEVLGTGGALKNAGGFLSSATFMVHNSDILSDINLEDLLEKHRSAGNLVTLAVHDERKFNRLLIDERGRLLGIADRQGDRSGAARPSARIRAFTGIAAYEPRFLDFIPEGGSGVVDAWFRAARSGHAVGTFDATGCSWTDIGTPAAYAAAVFDLLRKEGEVMYLHGSVRNCRDIDLQRNAVLEKECHAKKRVTLRNCIVLPGAIVPPSVAITGEGHSGSTVENCIVGPDFVIPLAEREVLCTDREGRQLIGTGGSDRRYYRTERDGGTAVLMRCEEGDTDFKRHMEYTGFFLRHGVPVPCLLESQPGLMEAIFEDAGDISLYTYLKCPRGSEETENLYRKVLDALVLIHGEATAHARECASLWSRTFDYEHFRWETKYFMERYVGGIAGRDPGRSAEIEEEFHQLALTGDSFAKTIIHRDFQSQNIMVKPGGTIKVIDYQGARMGPPAYDVASLLWDPYFRLDGDMRGRLLAYYTARMKKKGGGFDGQQFSASLLTCRLQRHMQALGAYGFLSRVKKKKHFLKFASEGVRLLREDMAEAGGGYPALEALIKEL